MMIDLLIQNATLIDGSGKPGWVGDLAVKDGRIEEIAPRIVADADETIDGKEQVLCPGFIDPHSHWDATHLEGGHGEIKLRQGVCVDLVGNCGESLAPCRTERIKEVQQLFHGAERWVTSRSFEQYTEELNAAQPGLRVMSHVGHGTLRIQAMGHAAGSPNQEQLDHMRRNLTCALEQGAAGLSTGLYYTPSGYADETELNSLMQIIAEKGRFHASHIRNEAGGIVEALKEVMSAGLKTGAATHISHLKLAGRNNWHRTDEVIGLFEKTRSQGLDLTCDVYPYNHSCTTLLSLIPPWALAGGVNGFCQRIADTAQLELIREQIRNGLPGWESGVQNSGFEGITISSIHSGNRDDLVGKTLASGSENEKLTPEDFIINLIKKEKGAISIICASMNEKVVAEFLKLPFSIIGSDGALSSGKPHPRAYGTFPRVIRRFVRELKALQLEEAIAKMTSLPADRLGLKDCGKLSPGRRADLVLFDPETFGDSATFEQPQQFSTGLDRVFLEGKLVWPPATDSHQVPGGFLAAPAHQQGRS